MKIGYFFWGFLSDKIGLKSKLSPEGQAFIMNPILSELMKSHDVTILAPNRDKDDFDKYGDKIFDSFEKEKRLNIYQNIKFGNIKLDYNPYLKDISMSLDYDLIVMDWRMPIIGRNTTSFLIESTNFELGYNSLTKKHHIDLAIQKYIIDNSKCPIIISDQDHAIKLQDEYYIKDKNKNVFIIEPSSKIKNTLIQRYSFKYPFWMDSNICDSRIKNVDLLYIGNNYNRMDMVNKYIKPYSEKYPYSIEFYGNWLKNQDSKINVLIKNDLTKIKFYDKIGFDNMNKYQYALGCPLLAPDSYNKQGLITPRILESLYFGSVPIGFDDMEGIYKILPKELVVSSVNSLGKILTYLKNISKTEYNNLRKLIWISLNEHDVKNYVKLIESIYENRIN